MSKKLTFSFVVILVLASVFATSCSDDKKDESSKKSKSESTKSSKKRVSSSKDSSFVLKVNKACNESGLNLLDEDLGITSSSTAEEVTDTLNTIEDEFDSLISELEDIEPDEDSADDYETLIDDLSHVRDLFPELADVVSEVQLLSDQAANAMTEAETDDIRNQLLDAQTKAEDINTDVTQTFDEINDLVDKLGLDDCLTSN